MKQEFGIDYSDPNKSKCKQIHVGQHSESCPSLKGGVHGSANAADGADELDIIDDAADELEIVDDAADELEIVDDAADDFSHFPREFPQPFNIFRNSNVLQKI